jgi:hypothetical protein
MRKILLGMAALVAITGAGCAIRGPAETVKTPPSAGSAQVVQRQFDAYNRHDLDAFVGTYSEDVKVYRMPGTQPMISGREQLREIFRKPFVGSAVHARLLYRTALGEKRVVDHERVEGLRDHAPFEAIVVYEVDEGLIRNVWMFYPE